MKPDPTREENAKKTDQSDHTHEPSESAIDEAVEESFPASDPVSVSVTKKK